MKKHRAFNSASVFFDYFIINFRIIQLTTPAAQIGSNVFFKLPYIAFSITNRKQSGFPEVRQESAE